MKKLLPYLFFLLPTLALASGNDPFIIRQDCSSGAYNIITQSCLGTPATVTISTVAISASTINASSGNVFSKTLSGSTTFTFSGMVDGQTIVVAVTNTSTFTATFTGVTWSGGSAPTQTTGAKTDVYTFIKVGSAIYGSVVQNF